MFSHHRHGHRHEESTRHQEHGECWHGARHDGRRHARGPFGPSDRLGGGGRGESGGERPHRHGRHGGGRSGRPLDHGDLRWLSLRLIAERPRHGYEIIKAIEEALGGMYSPSPGSVYPTLTLLEELGLVTASVDGAKKLYTLTVEGQAHLVENQASVAAADSRLQAAAAAYGGGPAPEVLRAMHNLREAVRLRIGKGPLTPESLSAVTAALDRAAGEIERA